MGLHLQILPLFPSKETTRTLRSSAVPSFVPPFNGTKFADNNLPDRCHKYWREIPDEGKQRSTLPNFKNVITEVDLLHEQ